jgi:hypothetical protein
MRGKQFIGKGQNERKKKTILELRGKQNKLNRKGHKEA